MKLNTIETNALANENVEVAEPQSHFGVVVVLVGVTVTVVHVVAGGSVSVTGISVPVFVLPVMGMSVVGANA